ncbi:hypothetical protein GCM10009616_22220 [Microlunatus lacustris]
MTFLHSNRDATGGPGCGGGYAPSMPKNRPGNWPLLAIGGLVVLNVVLLVALFARQPTTAVPAAAPPRASTSVTVEPSGSPDAEPSPTPTATASREPEAEREVPVASRLLAVSSERVAWRASRGGCDDEADVEVTTNGGRTWRSADPGVSAAVRLKSYGETSVFLIGADGQCRPSYAWQTSPDAEWQRDATRADDIWYRMPDNPDRVHAPGGRRSVPCSAGLADLAGLGTERAAALCRDGRLRTTDDGGRWTTVLKDSGGRALNADDNDFVVAREVPSCSGLVVQRFDVEGGGLDDASPLCRRGLSPDDSVAVAIASSTIWLWSGDEVEVF